jgi:hypothetical protein
MQWSTWYRTLRLVDPYAVVSRYFLDPTRYDEYLIPYGAEAETVRQNLTAAGMTGGVRKGNRSPVPGPRI